jgi:hypothetical protein
MELGLGVPAIVPSRGRRSRRPLPSPGSRWDGSPASQVRRGAPTPCFSFRCARRLAQRYRRPVARSLPFSARQDASAGRGWISATPAPSCSTEETGSRRFLGSPCARASALDPGRPVVVRPTSTTTARPSTVDTVSAPAITAISGLDHAARALAVYASPKGLPPPAQDSLLAARPALPGGWARPASGSVMKFRLRSSSSRLCLPHADTAHRAFLRQTSKSKTPGRRRSLELPQSLAPHGLADPRGANERLRLRSQPGRGGGARPDRARPTSHQDGGRRSLLVAPPGPPVPPAPVAGGVCRRKALWAVSATAVQRPGPRLPLVRWSKGRGRAALPRAVAQHCRSSPDRYRPQAAQRSFSPRPPTPSPSLRPTQSRFPLSAAHRHLR